MSLEPGVSLGSYRIVAPLGAGGMGEVYRASDSRLGRDVALKLLPEAFAADPDRRARFEREARVLAALNHPGIAHLYGFETASLGEGEEAYVLVMELVEGEDLAERLKRGAVPVDEALEIARRLAEALEEAHERGIVHRDLKPANVKLTPSGDAKVLDFGLARAWSGGDAEALSGSGALSQSPTLAHTGTAAGLILGTAAYMSPEQARGRAVDRRADIWAFGVVLYEMLTGRRLFEGETVTDVLAAVVRQEIDWSPLPGRTPETVRRLLRRCLERDPKRRLRDIGEARIALGEPDAGHHAGTETVVTPRAPRWPLVAMAAVTLFLAGTVAVLLLRSRTPEARPIVRYDVSAPQDAAFSLTYRPSVALSADGSQLAFVARSGGVERIYLRQRDDVDALAIKGTEGASNPVFSPDGAWIAFFADNKLKKVSPLGSVVTLAEVNDPRGISWVDEATIVLTPEATGPVTEVSAQGGPLRPVSTLDAGKGERTHRWPQVLPGGRAVLFTVGTFTSPDNYDSSSVEAVVRATGERRVLVAGARCGFYVPTGHLLFARESTLYAVGLDTERLETHGNPVAILQGIAGDTTTGALHLSVAADGTLAYLPGGAEASLLRLAWVDREGAVEELGLPAGVYNDLRLSPDGRQAAVAVGASGSADVWVYDFARKTFTRMTFEGFNATPAWSADGKDLYYTTIDPSGSETTIRTRPADGSREAVAVATRKMRGYLKMVSPDGRSAIVEDGSGGRGMKTDILAVPLEDGAEPELLVATRFDEYCSSVSPDGRWLAYQSDESSRPEVYVRDLGGSGARWQVSTGGGEEPRWSRDGRELFYRDDTRLMVVAVETRARFEAGAPRVLVDGIFNLRSDTGMSYDVDPGGERFLMVRPAVNRERPVAARVVLSWVDELRRLAPLKDPGP